MAPPSSLSSLPPEGAMPRTAGRALIACSSPPRTSPRARPPSARPVCGAAPRHCRCSRSRRAPTTSTRCGSAWPPAAPAATSTSTSWTTTRSAPSSRGTARRRCLPRRRQQGPLRRPRPRRHQQQRRPGATARPAGHPGPRRPRHDARHRAADPRLPGLRPRHQHRRRDPQPPRRRTPRIQAARRDRALHRRAGDSAPCTRMRGWPWSNAISA